MGYSKAIIETINDILKGADLNTSYTFYTPLFGKSKKSIFLLDKYYQLYKYSMNKSSDRRQYLIGYAREGILQTVSKWNYWFIKKKLNKLMQELRS